MGRGFVSETGFEAARPGTFPGSRRRVSFRFSPGFAPVPARVSRRIDAPPQALTPRKRCNAVCMHGSGGWRRIRWPATSGPATRSMSSSSVMPPVQ